MIDCTFRPHPAAVPMDNSLDGGESDTSAFERLLRMQALENTKQLVLIFHVKTDSVIFHEHNHLVVTVVQRINFYLGLFARSSEFHRVRNEVGKDQAQH